MKKNNIILMDVALSEHGFTSLGFKEVDRGFYYIHFVKNGIQINYYFREDLAYHFYGSDGKGHYKHIEMKCMNDVNLLNQKISEIISKQN